MSYLTLIIVFMLCIQRTYSTTNQTQDGDVRPDDNIGTWYSITTQLNTFSICKFPFIYESVEYTMCISMNGSLPECPIIVHGDEPHYFGICTQVIQEEPDEFINKTYKLTASESGICYKYTKHTRNTTYNGVLFAQFTTYQQCQLHCNSCYMCQGINFAESSKFCFLVMDNNSTSYIPDEEVKHYSRSLCPTTTVTLQSTTMAIDKHCNDTFVKKSNTKAMEGQLYPGGITVELCKRECLFFKVRDSKDLCVGFDFHVNNFQCFLYNDANKFKVTNTTSKVHHYTRQDCLSLGYY